MARDTPRVEGATLIDRTDATQAILVGTPAWYAWLDGATSFAFVGASGSFTARKERRGGANEYWKAYRKRAGFMRSAYLGKTHDLTLERLQGAAATLAEPTIPASAVARPDAHPATLIAEPTVGASTPLPTGTVTFLFTDIAGSTRLWEQHPQAMLAALARHDALLRDVIAAHGGEVFKTVGDGCHAVFARATDALAAAIVAQRTLTAEPWGSTGPLHVRMALHTGAADLRNGDYFGPPLNRVARILALGHGDQILLSQATAALVGDGLPPGATLRNLGAHALKDLPQPEPIFQLVAADLPSEFPPLRTLDGRPPATPSLPPHLLATKLYAPPARPDLVARPRLFERLSAGLSGKLTLIAAPAGFGKTTLVSAWMAETAQGKRQKAQDDAERDEAGLPFAGSLLPFSVAWVSLDALDNDPTRFWSYVSAASNMLAPGTGDAALALLQAPQPPPLEAIVTTLLNGLSAALPRERAGFPAVLVLDDYHTIEAPAIHRALATLTDHLPPQLHLLIATRADPPLPLARLRACRQLSELRAADLRFSVEEATTFLTDLMGLALSEADIAALEARTEGWIAGLQLAALAMRDRSDLAGFIGAFTGSNRLVMQYLAEEVFARQPSHIQTFLLHTAILERMCGPLCDALLGLIPDQPPGTNDEGHTPARASAANFDQQPAPLVVGPASDSYSQLILDQLECANLFLIPLDDERQWYRYHHLFAEVLRHRLISGASAAATMALHSRAAQWFEGQGLVVEAVHHALAAEDWERAARLIEEHGALLMLSGQVQTVLGWLNALPAAVVQRRPLLCLVHALGLMLANQSDAAEVRLHDAERCLQLETPADLARVVKGFVAVVRGNIRYFAGDLARAISFVQQGLALLPETTTSVAAGIMSAIARAAAAVFVATAYKLTGDVSEVSERRAAEAIAPVRATGNLTATLNSYTYLAYLQVLRGHLRAAATTYAEVERLVPGQDALQSLVGSPSYYAGMGDLRREWNHLEEAETYLARGMALVQGGLANDADVILRGYLALARVQQARGHSEEALATLDACMQVARERQFFPLLIDQAAALRARLQLLQGDLAAAQRWAEGCGLAPDDEINFPREAGHLTLARVRIAAGQTEAVLPVLGRLLADAESKARMHSAIEILILQALALHVQGDRPAALTALEQAFALAEPEGYVRIFVDEGAPMAQLLQAARVHGIAPNYISKLLAVFRDSDQKTRRLGDKETETLDHPRTAALVEPLTDRELEILQLIAEGLSNQAIADRLVIALSTVKRHINNLFGKLAVQSRTQALVRARELQLL